MSTSQLSSPVAEQEPSIESFVPFAAESTDDHEFGSPETIRSENNLEAFLAADDETQDHEKPQKKRKSLKPKRLSLGGSSKPKLGAAKQIILLRQKMKAAGKSPVAQSRSQPLESQSDGLPARASVAVAAPKSARPSITKPMSPKLQVEKRLKEHQRALPPPSQDQLLEKLEAEARQKRLEMKKAQRLYQKLKQNGFHETCAASEVEVAPKKVTIPKTPQSKLDQKRGKRVPSLLRKSPVQAAKKKCEVKRVNGLTVPEPFHFQIDQRLSASQAAAPTDDSPAAGLTAAELAQKFQQDPRHFALPIAASHPPATAPGGLTVAHAPVLQTELRSKSAQRSRVQSREEREEQLMQELQAKPFKARPLDRRILYESAGEIGVPKVQPRPVTEPVGFELQYEKARASHQHAEPSEGPAVPESTFKARPVPVTLKEPAPLPPKREVSLTLPSSPKLHGRERASSAPARRQKPHHAQQEAERQQREQAQLQAAAQKPRGLTQPQEFSLLTASRGAHYQAMLEEKVQREQAQLQAYLGAMQSQQRIASTKLMRRALQTVDVPAKPAPRDATVPQPFQLSSVSKHEEARERLRAKKQLEDAQRAQQASAFKAKPVPKTLFEDTENVLQHNRQHAAPHEPVQPQKIVLESDLRAEKRRQFDAQVAEKQAALATAKREEEQRQVEAEQRLLQELRRKTIAEGGMAFKAQPVGLTTPAAGGIKRRATSTVAAKKPAMALSTSSASVDLGASAAVLQAAPVSTAKSALAGGARRVAPAGGPLR